MPVAPPNNKSELDIQGGLPSEPRWAGVLEVSGMAGPIILGTLSWTVMQFVDAAMVGSLGTDQLAALGSAFVWSYAVSEFCIGVCSCVGTFVAQSLGRGRRKDCGAYAWHGIYLALVFGSIAIVLWPLSDVLFGLMNHAPEVRRMELIYFKIRLFGYVFIAWQTALAAFFQAIHRPGIPTAVAIGAILLNAFLDYVLIFGNWGFPRLEIAGAAWGTVIALMVNALVLQVIFLTKPFDREYNTRNGYRFEMRKVRELFRIGWPTGLTGTLIEANFGIFTSFIVGYFGSVALAAHTAAFTLGHFSFLPALGLNLAITPIVGRWIGEGRIELAKARAYTAMKMGMGYMGCMGLLFAIFGGPLVAQFFSADPEVVRLGHILLILAALFQIFDAMVLTMSGALRGAGDTRWIAITTALLSYLLFLPLATYLALGLGWGAIGAWTGAAVFVVVLGVVFYLRFRSEAWRHVRIFETDRTPVL